MKSVFLLIVVVFMLPILLTYALFLGPHFIHAQSGSPDNTAGPMIGVKITSLKANQTVPIGPLTIYGTSSDTPETICKVFVDWNDTKPMENVTGIGSGGINDYSKWTFTYTDRYHLIGEGNNELTSKISCYGNQTNSVTTKFFSVNITGTTKSPNSSISGTYENDIPQPVHNIDNNSTLPQYSNSHALSNKSKSVSKTEDSKSNVYIEFSGEYSGNKNNNEDNKTIKFKTSSIMISSKADKTQDERNYFDVDRQNLTRLIHNLVREKLNRISDQYVQ